MNKSGLHLIQLPRTAMEQLASKFPEGVNVLVVPPQEAACFCEFIRLPKAGEKDPTTGLPRTTLIELLQEAGPERIAVKHLRKRGAATGITLIPRQQLINYINAQPAPEWLETEEEE
ncbi:MAG: hypothetical protein IPK22_11390 [Verrucomicrobiaceae bacterium]|nr:hypothetical protein [Verrucomicrobiaceae bacterium]